MTVRFHVEHMTVVTSARLLGKLHWTTPVYVTSGQNVWTEIHALWILAAS
jgi:hypothetical protein